MLKDLGYLGSSNIVGVGISAIFWFYLANLLGAEEYGQIQYYIAIAGIVYLISSFASPNSITIYAAKNIKIHSTLYLVSLVGGIIAILVILGVFQRLDVGLLVFGFIIYDLAIYYFLGKKWYAKYSKNFLLQKILAAIFAIGFYYIFGLEGIIYGLALSYVHLSIVVYKILRESKIDFSVLKSRGGFITNNYFESAISGVRGEIDKIIIAPMLGFMILGNYALAMQVYVVLMIFSSVIYKYVLPQDASGVSNYILKKISIFIAIGISILGITVVPIILSLFFPKFEDAVIAIQIMSISVVPATIGYMYISKFLSIEKSKFVLLGRIVSLSTLVLGMIILPKIFGMAGAAGAFVLSTCVTTSFFVLAYEKIRVKK